MQKRIKAVLILGKVCKLDAPLLFGTTRSPCHTNTERLEGRKAGNTGNQVVKTLAENSIKSDQKRPERKNGPGLCGEGRTQR
jgi:hypothetical protein